MSSVWSVIERLPAPNRGTNLLHCMSLFLTLSATPTTATLARVMLKTEQY